MAASYIDELVDSGKVIAIDDCRTGCRTDTGHGVIENPGWARIFAQIFEEGLIVNFFERRLPSLRASKKITPCTPVPIGSDKNRKIAEAIRCIASQRFCQRRESKATCIVFSEDADTCKRTKNAIKRPCLGACYLRQFFSVFCSILQQMVKNQPRSDRNRCVVTNPKIICINCGAGDTSAETYSGLSCDIYFPFKPRSSIFFHIEFSSTM